MKQTVTEIKFNCTFLYSFIVFKIIICRKQYYLLLYENGQMIDINNYGKSHTNDETALKLFILLFVKKV